MILKEKIIVETFYIKRSYGSILDIKLKRKPVCGFAESSFISVETLNFPGTENL